MLDMYDGEVWMFCHAWYVWCGGVDVLYGWKQSDGRNVFAARLSESLHLNLESVGDQNRKHPAMDPFPLIGRDWSPDADAGLWLVDTNHVILVLASDWSISQDLTPGGKNSSQNFLSQIPIWIPVTVFVLLGEITGTEQ